MKKEKEISIRCSKKEKTMIERAAISKGKSISQYVLDCSIAELERKTDKMKRLMIARVEKDEKVNKLYYLLEQHQTSIPSNVREELCNYIREIGEEFV